jgi:hypothetical protein
MSPKSGVVYHDGKAYEMLIYDANEIADDESAESDDVSKED